MKLYTTNMISMMYARFNPKKDDQGSFVRLLVSAAFATKCAVCKKYIIYQN